MQFLFPVCSFCTFLSEIYVDNQSLANNQQIIKKKILIERSCRYVADFVYTDRATGRTVVEDTKGFRTKEYIIKRKLMLHVHGIRIKEI